MPRQPRRLHEFSRVATQVSGRVTYPIENFKELAEALGGENGRVVFEGREYKIGQARRLVPDDYFPIDSEEELVAKAHDVALRGGLSDPSDIEWGEELDKAPDDAGDPPMKPEKAPGSPRVPHLRGKRERE